MKKGINAFQLLFFFMFSINGLAQIQGNVTDKNQKPIEFVTVIIKKKMTVVLFLIVEQILTDFIP